MTTDSEVTPDSGALIGTARNR
jgi:translocator protein